MAVKAAVKIKLAHGVCFVCGGSPKPLVPGHKVCVTCHKPSKCHTCKKQGNSLLKNQGYTNGG